MKNSEKFGLITYVKVKPNFELEYLKKSAVALHRISQESSFINYFQLQSEKESSHFAVYSTWSEEKRHINDMQPIEEQAWRLLRSETVGDQIYEMTMLHEKFGRFVYFQVKPGLAEASYMDLTKLIDEYYNERTFLNIFVLQDLAIPEKFALYETWIDKDDFINVQMRRPYRRNYEKVILTKLIEAEKVQYWQLIGSETQLKK